MTRLSLSLLLLFPLAAFAADPLPEGVELRLGGSTRYCVDHTSAISPDGKRIATCPQNEPIQVWDTNGKRLHTHDKQWSSNQLAWTADGKLIGLGGQYMVEWADANDRGLSTEKWTAIRKADDALPPGPYVYRTALSPDGRRVAAVLGLKDTEREVAVYPFTGNSTLKLAKPDYTFTLAKCDAVSFSGDGKTLFAIQPYLNKGGRVVAYDLTAKKPDEPVWILDLPVEEQKFIEQDGKKVAVQGKGWPSVVHSTDGKRVVIEFPYGTFEVWDGSKAKKLHSWEVPWYGIPGNAERAMIALSPDGKRLALSSREKTGLVGGVVYDLDTGKEVVKLAAGSNVPHGALKYSPDGKRLYRSYQVWDTETGKELSPATGHRGGTKSVVVSGDGKTIATSGADLTARGWDAKTGEEKWRADFPYPVSLRRLDGETAVAVERLWNNPLEKPLLNLTTGTLSALPGGMGQEKKQKFAFGERTVRDELVALSPDGKTAVTLDRTVPALHVWDWPNGKPRDALEIALPEKQILGRVNEVAFTPDGKELVGLLFYEDEKPRQGSMTGPPHVPHLERWDLATGKRGKPTAFEGFTTPAMVSNGKRLLVVQPGKVVTDALSGEQLLSPTDDEKRTPRYPSPQGATLSRDGNTLAAPNDFISRGDIRWYDLKTGKETLARSVGDRSGMVLAFLPDGRLVSAGESVFVWKK